MKTLIKNATVVLPGGTEQTSVLDRWATEFAQIEPAISTRRSDQIVDGAGLFLLPGIVDDQVHFREPGLTHKEDLAHASRACAKGGVTSFLEMPNTIPNCTTQQRLDEKLELASRDQPGQLRFLYRRDDGQSRRIEKRHAHARHQDFHRLQHRRFTGR